MRGIKLIRKVVFKTVVGVFANLFPVLAFAALTPNIANVRDFLPASTEPGVVSQRLTPKTNVKIVIFFMLVLQI